LSGVEWVAISTNKVPPTTVPLAEHVRFFRIKGN